MNQKAKLHLWQLVVTIIIWGVFLSTYMSKCSFIFATLATLVTALVMLLLTLIITQRATRGAPTAYCIAVFPVLAAAIATTFVAIVVASFTFAAIYAAFFTLSMMTLLLVLFLMITLEGYSNSGSLTEKYFLVSVEVEFVTILITMCWYIATH